MASSVGMRIAVLNFDSKLPPGVREPELVVAEGLKLGVCLGLVREDGTAKRYLTRVLHEDPSKAEQIFYATSTHQNINEAIGSLRRHEGFSQKESIGYINFQGGRRFKNPELASKIEQWARDKHFDGVVWVDEPSNIPALMSKPFMSTRDAVMPMVKADPVLLGNTKDYLGERVDFRRLTGVEKSVLGTIPYLMEPSSAEFQKTIDQTADLLMSLPQTHVARSQWYKRTDQWGPLAKEFPAPTIPDAIRWDYRQLWMRRLVVTIALKYEGLQYKGVKAGDKFKTSNCEDIPKTTTNGEAMRGHFPGRGYGLDCSNFVSWVYNLAGIHFTSDCGALVDHPSASQSKGIGRILGQSEKLQQGDLIFLDRRDPGDPHSPPHVLMFCGTGEQIGKAGDKSDYYIDSTSARKSGVAPTELRKGNWCYPSADNPRFVRMTRPFDAVR